MKRLVNNKLYPTDELGNIIYPYVLSVNGGQGNVSVSGSLVRVVIEKTANYDLLDSDDVVNVTSNTVTITLSEVVGVIGRQHTIINSGTGIVTVVGYLGQKINTLDDFTLNQYDSITVVSNNGNWRII